MTDYQAVGRIEKIEWEAPLPHEDPYAVELRVVIPAADFTGLNINLPITITQETS